VLQLLETFCIVAEAGSLTRAGDRLHMTQPAITRQLRALERQLGAVLLTRTPRGVTLTPIGDRVLAHARQAVAAGRACREVAAEASAAGARRLRIAAGLMATQYVLPPVVARFRSLYPDVEVDLQPAHHRIAIERLLGYEVDAAVIASPVRSPQLRATPILHDPLLLVGAAGADRPPGRLADLRGRTLLVLTSGTGLHDQIETALRHRGIVCHLIEHPTAETIKTSVALEMGVTILPASAVRVEIANGTLAASPIVDWPEAARDIHLLVRTDGQTPRPVTAFSTLLREHYARDRGVAAFETSDHAATGRRSPRLASPPTTDH
jgi:DNA-binding transcriptional LysR family regulator